MAAIDDLNTAATAFAAAVVTVTTAQNGTFATWQTIADSVTQDQLQTLAPLFIANESALKAVVTAVTAQTSALAAVTDAINALAAQL